MKTELKPIKKHILTLDELITLMDDYNPKINFVAVKDESAMEYARKYSEDGENIVKLNARNSSTEEGLSLTAKPYTVEYCEFGKSRSPANNYTFNIPSEVLLRLGYKIGDRVDKLLIYAEHVGRKKMNCYVLKDKG